MTSREPLWDQPELTEVPAHRIEGLLRDAPHGRRETVGCHPVSGEPLQVVRLPQPTWIPMIAAATIAIAAIAVLASAYVVAGVALLGTLGSFAVWAWEPSETGQEIETETDGVLPVNKVDRLAHTHVATIGTLLIVGSLFASILFSVMYLWNVRPDFTTTAGLATPVWALGAAGLAAAVVIAARLARLWGASLLLDLVILAASAGVVACLWMALLPLDPWGSAAAATLWVLAGFVAVQLFILAYWSLFLALRSMAGQRRKGVGLPEFNRATYATVTGAMVLNSVAIMLAPQWSILS